MSRLSRAISSSSVFLCENFSTSPRRRRPPTQKPTEHVPAEVEFPDDEDDVLAVEVVSTPEEMEAMYEGQ